MFDSIDPDIVKLRKGWPEDLWNENTLDADTEIYEFNFNLTNFDNIGMAFLTVFQCIT